MKNSKYIRRTFVRQLNKNDCGIACIRMILNYAGKNSALSIFEKLEITGEEGITLLQLRNIANSVGLSSRCVEMDIDFLQANNTPCILHLTDQHGANHFQVCFGPQKRHNTIYYLMSDPARYHYYISQMELEKRWQSRSALYFDSLLISKEKIPAHHWALLLSMDFFPRGLWIAVPVLNVVAALFGVSVSWTLQRGIDDPLFQKPPAFIAEVVFLLLLLMLFRALLIFLKQRILIKLNLEINEKLMRSFIIQNPAWNNSLLNYSSTYCRTVLRDIQKVQDAFNIFISILLSDAFLIVLMLAITAYILPAAAIIDISYIAIQCYISIRRLHATFFEYAELNELAGLAEQSIKHSAKNSPGSGTTTAEADDHRLVKHAGFLNSSKLFALKLSAYDFFYDSLGTMNVIAIFCLGLVKIRQMECSYISFMVVVILAFLLNNLMTRITGALTRINDGAEACRQFLANIA